MKNNKWNKFKKTYKNNFLLIYFKFIFYFLLFSFVAFITPSMKIVNFVYVIEGKVKRETQLVLNSKEKHALIQQTQ